MRTCTYLSAVVCPPTLSCLQVPSSGLSARADNVANWKQQLRSWQEGIQERCASSELGCVCRQTYSPAVQEKMNVFVCVSVCGGLLLSENLKA